MSPVRPVDLITLPEARYLALRAQRLEHGERRSKRKPPKSRLLEIIDDVGCLQLDSISVVSRAHETSMWSRAGNFNTADLAALHHPDVELIEYWAHAASLLPVSFLPYLRRQMEKYAHPVENGWGRWGVENEALHSDVLKTIERLGPVSTRAFERPEGIERTPWAWFGGKPAKQALDYLWTIGELVVHRRVGFERIYELTDRAFPGIRTAPLPSRDEEARFFTQRALRAVGIGTVPWIADYIRAGTGRYVSAAEATNCLDSLEREGNAFRVSLEGQKGDSWLDPALVPDLESFRGGSVRPTASTLLSPFDNLMWRRDRALAVFGMDYRLESYTPEPKRIYGYYTLPILIEGKLVGRLDPRYRRRERLLSVQAIHLEPGIRPTVGLAKSIASLLRTFTGFLGGDEIEVLAANPETLLPIINGNLA
jgi:uncharacterized protein YcaQ